MSGISLTTHVLDQSSGKPGAGIGIELYRLGDAETLLSSAITNTDGRTDSPILSADDALAGEYQLVFMAGDYFRRQGVELPDPPFLDKVVLRFGMTENGGHYHVPLLLSPYGYSTYRGS